LIKQWIIIVTLQINPFYDGLRDDWSIDDYPLLSGAYKLIINTASYMLMKNFSYQLFMKNLKNTAGRAAYAL
jgi:hypothetical protein